MFPPARWSMGAPTGYLPSTQPWPQSRIDSGSNVVKVPTYLFYWWMWVGLPITGVNIPPDTTVSSWSLPPFSHWEVYVTLSNKVTGSSYGAISFGGAIHSAPAGTALTFLSGTATISAFGTGSGAAGTYTLTKSANLLPGSTLYYYDTPATIYVTGGPRPLKPQDLLWTDALPFGAISQKVYGTSASKQTVIAATSDGYMPLSVIATHSSGSGKMWVLPSGSSALRRETVTGIPFKDLLLGSIWRACKPNTPKQAADEAPTRRSFRIRYHGPLYGRK